jgi:hypothetical protein
MLRISLEMLEKHTTRSYKIENNTLKVQKIPDVIFNF